jgi:tetratricopeptide (TPR) repeat protein
VKKWRSTHNIASRSSVSEAIELFSVLTDDFSKLISEEDEIYYQYLNSLVSYGFLLFKQKDLKTCKTVLKRAEDLLESMNLSTSYFIEILRYSSELTTSEAVITPYFIHEVALLFYLKAKLNKTLNNADETEKNFKNAFITWKHVIQLKESVFEVLHSYGDCLWEYWTYKTENDSKYMDEELLNDLKEIYENLITLGDDTSLKSHKILSEIYWILGNIEEEPVEEIGEINQYLYLALDEYVTLLELHYGQNDDIRLKILEVSNLIGNNLEKQSQLLEAIEYYVQGIQYANSSSNPIIRKNLLILYLQYGKALLEIQDYSQAFNILLQTVNNSNDFITENPDIETARLLQFSARHNLARSLMALGNYPESLVYIKQMKEDFIHVVSSIKTMAAGNSKDIATTNLLSSMISGCIFLAESYLFNSNPKSASLYLQTPIDILESLKDKKFDVSIIISMAPAFIYQASMFGMIYNPNDILNNLKLILKKIKALGRNQQLSTSVITSYSKQWNYQLMFG